MGITKDPVGKIAWIETGNERSGLKHVLTHLQDFQNQGISREELPTYIMEAIHQGKIVGYQDRNKTRAIYEVTYEGVPHKIAITVSDKRCFQTCASPNTSWWEKSRSSVCRYDAF